jgi:hypothetical protein
VQVDAGHHQSVADQHGQCSLCAACCSALPIVSALPTVGSPYGASGARFPDLFTPAPSFLSEGQERPPRSI